MLLDGGGGLVVHALGVGEVLVEVGGEDSLEGVEVVKAGDGVGALARTRYFDVVVLVEVDAC